MDSTMTPLPVIRDLSVPLERDVFLRSLLRELAGALQEVVGLDEAAGFISIVGQRIGDQINESYRTALGTPRLTREQVADVLVDLKRRIQGDFYVIERDEDRIVLGNRACPFAEKVEGRPSHVHDDVQRVRRHRRREPRLRPGDHRAGGRRGDSDCRIVIHLRPASGAEEGAGREYFRG